MISNSVLASTETAPTGQNTSHLVEFYFPELIQIVALRPRYRWQVWLHFRSEHGLGAALTVEMIARAKKGGWVIEWNGLLYSASTPAAIQALNPNERRL
jgi:hypothetical protein